jgi:hypothetical protein
VSDKYNYDDHRVHLSDSDSGKNNAQALGGGYHLDVQLQKDWPGIDADPNKQVFDPDKMKAVADKIDGLISALNGQGSGTSAAIQKSGAPPFGPETWAAASYLKTAAGEMAGAVADYTQKLVANLTAASQAIRSAADSYGKAEDANQQSGQNQQASLGQQPTSFS